MPRALGFLDRFRRLVAPPGRPSEAVGVPAAGDDLAAELAPLLAELESIGEEAERIGDEARREADRLRDGAAAESEAMARRARGDVDGERARAAAAVRDVGAAPGPDAELARLAAIREDRVGSLVAEILECVRRADP